MKRFQIMGKSYLFQQKNSQKNRVKKSSQLSAEKIQYARKKKGLSQRALAKQVGKSQSWIRDLEKGRCSAKAEDRENLQSILEL